MGNLPDLYMYTSSYPSRGTFFLQTACIWQSSARESVSDILPMQQISTCIHILRADADSGSLDFVSGLSTAQCFLWLRLHLILVPLLCVVGTYFCTAANRSARG